MKIPKVSQANLTVAKEDKPSGSVKTPWNSNLKQQSEKLFDKDKISKRINFTGTKKAATDRMNNNFIV